MKRGCHIFKRGTAEMCVFTSLPRGNCQEIHGFVALRCRLIDSLAFWIGKLFHIIISIILMSHMTAHWNVNQHEKGEGGGNKTRKGQRVPSPEILTTITVPSRWRP